MKESVIQAPPARVFAFHQLPDALERLTPSWAKARVIQGARSLDVGERAIVEIRVLGVWPMRCVSEHTQYDPPHSFEDRMRKGPFRRWIHRHLVAAQGSGTVLRDEVDYELPLGPLGRLLAPVLVEPRLRRLFDYRHEATRAWCES